MSKEPRVFVRCIKFGEERKFPEHGVAVKLTNDSQAGMIVHVRDLMPEEKKPRLKGLTPRHRKP